MPANSSVAKLYAEASKPRIYATNIGHGKVRLTIYSGHRCDVHILTPHEIKSLFHATSQAMVERLESPHPQPFPSPIQKRKNNSYYR